MARNRNDHTSTNWCIPGIVMKSALVPEKFSICSLNSQSICARRLSKLDELRQIVSLTNVDIICVNETWLNNKTEDNVVALQGYNLIRHDRLGRLGGGLIIYIKKCLKFRIVDKSAHTMNSAYTEFISIECVVNDCKILLTAFYNPPDADCCNVLEEILSKYGAIYNDIFFLGDFNTNLLDCNSSKTTRLNNLMTCHAL